MKTTGHTVLITGGSAGIGYEIAKRLSAEGNTVIITGRDERRLHQAVGSLENGVAIRADVTSDIDTTMLVNRITDMFPMLNMVINNAAAANIHPLTSTAETMMEEISNEILTNYLSVIRLNASLLPLLQQQSESAIVNVTSIVAYVPGSLATYSASKAALHSYTQSLRWELSGTHPVVKVFELMPPLVNTDFSKPIGGEKGIPATDVADAFIKGLSNDEFEIRVGMTEQMYRLFLSSPDQAFAAMHTSERILKTAE